MGIIVKMEYLKKELRKARKKIKELEDYIRGMKEVLYLLRHKP